MLALAKKKKKLIDDLDVTPIMNLMIVLVPVLLLGMVFTHIRVLNIQLPELVERLPRSMDQPVQALELLITDENLQLFYPPGQLLKSLPKKNSDYDYAALTDYLRQVKSTFKQQKIDKKAITLKPEAQISYQVLVNVMDHVIAYPDVLVASVVQAELFPQVAFADASSEADLSK